MAYTKAPAARRRKRQVTGAQHTLHRGAAHATPGRQVTGAQRTLRSFQRQCNDRPRPAV